MGLIIFQSFEDFFWARGNPKHNKFLTFFFVRVEFLTSEWYGDLFFWKSFYHLSKFSVQPTIVPSRLRSELCAWRDKLLNHTLSVSRRPRPLAAGSIQNAEKIENFLAMQHNMRCINKLFTSLPTTYSTSSSWLFLFLSSNLIHVCSSIFVIAWT